MNQNRDPHFNENNLSDHGSDDESNASNYDNDVPDGITKRALSDYLLYLRGNTRSTNNDVVQGLKELQKVVASYVRYYMEQTANVLRDAIGINMNDYIDVNASIANIDCTQWLHSIYN